MIAATATTARQFETGDVVYGRPIFEGKIQPRRKGIVLGPFTDDNMTQVVVWWYGLGESCVSTSTLMWNGELTPAGDIYEMNARRAEKLSLMCDAYPRARTLCNYLRRHAARMTSLGTKHPAV